MAAANVSGVEKQDTFLVEQLRTLLAGFTYCWNTPIDIYLGFKLFSVHYGISGKCSDPSRSSQGVFTSSAIQTFTS